MNYPTKEMVELIRKHYPAGCRIVLDRMDDPQAPPIGTQGTVTGVDDIGSIMVAWDSGGSLSVAYGEDICHRVASEDEIKESLNWLGKRQTGPGHCPRCGKALESFDRHATSRRAAITICDECGTAEALEDVGIIPKISLCAWHCTADWQV